MLLEGAINALGKVGLMLNVRKDDLDKVLAVLPALKRPTISTLSDAGLGRASTRFSMNPRSAPSFRA